MFNQQKIKALIKKTGLGRLHLQYRIARIGWLILGRSLKLEEIKYLNERSLRENISAYDIISELFLSNEGVELAIKRALQNHLYYIHNARLKMIRTLLPPGEQILDLGGANAPLYKMGYPHSFKQLVMVDLPSGERHEEFRKDVCTEGVNGKVEILYADMTNLRTLSDQSFDFIWSGQSIEHVTPEGGRKMCQEAYRLLKPSGRFVLDTPNRLITEIHTATVGGGFIHPDHKIEYTPESLKHLLTETGFKIEIEKGICEMPFTAKTKQFFYQDFVVGSPITDNINSSYILFYNCKK